MCDFKNDKLVFYFEEMENDTEQDLQIFIVFDEYENEYYITGSRNSVKYRIVFEQFKFYCKSIKHVMEYVSSILDYSYKINYTLYNFPNLYDDENIDFHLLNERKNTKNFIVGEDSVMCSTFMKKIFKPMLKNLKNVRY
jgi:hypothetical protein